MAAYANPEADQSVLNSQAASTCYFQLPEDFDPGKLILDVGKTANHPYSLALP
jgi:hypothetical protein